MMGFEAIPTKHCNRLVAPVAIRLGHRGVDVVMSFSEAFYSNLNWKAGDRLEMAIGTGPDLGTLRLKAGPDGRRIYRTSKSSSRLATQIGAGRLPDVPLTLKTIACDVRVDMVTMSATIVLPWPIKGLLKVAS